jgi:uncharacterized protein (DUF4415 family)
VKKSSTTRYSAEELGAMRERGESHSNWTKAGSVTRAALERSVTTDPDEVGMLIDWKNAVLELPEPKAVLHMRIDRHVLEFFRQSGSGYQTRINAVLRAYVKGQEHRIHKRAQTR